MAAAPHVTILVKGGQVDLYLEDGTTMVVPRGYGMIHDTAGEQLDRCSLFLGPFEDAGEHQGELPPDARDYFGSDYVARKARIDVPAGRWDPLGLVREITYYRLGMYEDDWHHEFSKPVELLGRGQWLRLRMPADCKMTWRGIVKP